jgi:preprotein translocase subunit SecD
MNSAVKKVILIFLLALVCFYVSLPKTIPIKFNLGKFSINKTFTRTDLVIKYGRINIERKFDLVLGLDLAGGSHLVFEADLAGIPQEKRKTALDGVRDVIEKRVNLFGVSEPNVQTSAFGGRDRVIVELPGVKDTKQAVDIIGKTAQLIFAQIETRDGNDILAPTDLTGADLKSSAVTFDRTSGKPSVGIEFTQEGAVKFEKLTADNVGKALPILLDNQIISAPVVKEKIAGGSAQISGDFSLDEAKNLSIELNAGALPVPVRLVEQRTVGATLGGESVARSVQAGLVGLFMVLLFMFLSYGKLGLFADIALIIFGTITLALYKLIPVTLTLPGIAGFLLSVGMAVDSNILIFERYNEERGKRPYKDALEVSFGRAWDSIRDANIATLVTAFILANPFDWSFLHTSGPVRGFAITLALGIGISLFTGIVVTRNLLRAFVKEKDKI